MVRKTLSEITGDPMTCEGIKKFTALMRKEINPDFRAHFILDEVDFDDWARRGVTTDIADYTVNMEV